MLSRFKDFILVFVTLLISLKLRMEWNISPVLLSCSIALIASYSRIFSHRQQALIYCASFVAMSEIKHLDHIWILIGLSLLCSILFRYFHNRLIGIGGKLGSIAFLSCVILYLVSRYSS